METKAYAFLTEIMSAPVRKELLSERDGNRLTPS